MTDAEIIKYLGGQTILASKLGVASSRVGNWISRGIPFAYRNRVAALVLGLGGSLPDGFLDAKIMERAA